MLTPTVPYGGTLLRLPSPWGGVPSLAADPKGEPEGPAAMGRGRAISGREPGGKESTNMNMYGLPTWSLATRFTSHGIVR